MMRFVLSLVLAVVIPLAFDYYVYRNWRRFVHYREEKGTASLRWTLPLYRAFMLLMPLALPVYFYFSRWWEVEPKLPRAVFIGFWAFYYAPKIIIALALAIKDGIRFITWLFRWFQQRLLAPTEEASDTVPEPNTASPDLSDMKRYSRRDFLQKAGWGLASAPYVVVGYSAFRTLYDFQIHRVEIPLPDLPRSFDGLTIGQLSDLHAGSFFSTRPFEEAVDLLLSLQPDLIAVTGDYVNHDVNELTPFAPALNRLQADLGTFGCLGNHDHYAQTGQVIDRVRSTPIDLLVNEHRTLEIGGAKLHVIGTDNTGFNQYYADLPGAVAGIDADPNGEELRLLLAHVPTFWDSHVRPEYPDIDVMLCGHTHGGQLGVDLGPLQWSLARVAYPRWAGLYAEPRDDQGRRQFLYVNRGLGTVGPPLRIGIRPEVTLLTLRRV